MLADLHHEEAAFRLMIRREVTAAYANLEAARNAAEYLREQVVGTLEENTRLLQRSFSAGRIEATEVVVFRREFVESQREYVEAEAEARLAQINLDLATGRLPIPAISGEEK